MARKRREAAKAEEQQSVSIVEPEPEKAGQLTCPECGKTFARAASLGAHRKQAHGIAGASAQASRSRRGRRPATRPTTAGATPRPRGRRRPTSAVTGNGHVDRDALLRALFPNGIPARQELISRVNRWLDEAEQLAAAK